MIGPDPDGLDLATKCSAPRQAGNDGQLQGSDSLVIGHDNDQELAGVLIDSVECLQVRGKIGWVVAGRAELVVRQHVHYRFDVVTPCCADGVVGHAASITVRA